LSRIWVGSIGRNGRKRSQVGLDSARIVGGDEIERMTDRLGDAFHRRIGVGLLLILSDHGLWRRSQSRHLGPERLGLLKSGCLPISCRCASRTSGAALAGDAVDCSAL
jgi:hypothetical protein